MDRRFEGRVFRRLMVPGMVIAVAVLAGCDDDGPLAPTPGPRVHAVEVTPASGVWSGTLNVGDTASLVATARAADGSVLQGTPVAWSSSDTAVATVSGGGMVRARAEGTAEIRAAAGGRTGRVSVVVSPAPSPEPVPVASVAITPAGAVLEVGESRIYSARALDAFGNELPGRQVAWRSDAPGVASVTEGGEVAGLAPGYGQITATVEGRSASVGLTVTEPAVARIEVTPVPLVLEVGESRPLSVRAFDARDREITGRAVTWSTSTPQILTVSGTGLVTALAPGYGDVTAEVEGVTMTVGVTVPTPPAPVTSVMVLPHDGAVLAGSASPSPVGP